MLGTAMPKAAIDEDGEPTRGKDEVRGAALGKRAMEPEPGAGGVQCLAQQQLGRSVHLAPAAEVATPGGADPPIRGHPP